jgi:Bacterial protein of unknown function (DUF882)
VRHFDPRLFDLLYDLTASLHDAGGEIDVVCGYRTPQSSEFLRTRSAHTGVARHSLHMQAEAIDIRLAGIPTWQTRDAALRLHRGGVGYYRSLDFVQVDVGPGASVVMLFVPILGSASTFAGSCCLTSCFAARGYFIIELRFLEGRRFFARSRSLKLSIVQLDANH